MGDLSLDPELGFETRAVHGNEPHHFTHNGEVIAPISLSSSFRQQEPGVRGPYVYTRWGNPTRDKLEQSLACLEQAKYACTFPSGVACCNALCHVLLRSGDHVVSIEDAYSGCMHTFRDYATHGIDFSFVDGRVVENFAAAVIKGRTRLVWLESVTNPVLRITDISAVSKAVKKIDEDIVIVVDNTFMSSYLQQPLKLDADISMHSLTKYMNGHHDVTMGALMTNSESLFQKYSAVQYYGGAVPSSFDCYLVSRSLATLPLRMERHSASAMIVAQMLKGHPKVRKVIYPGLADHEQHDLARRQSPRGLFSGILGFYVKSGDPDAGKKLIKSFRLITHAASLGGAHSLCELPILISASLQSPEMLAKLNIDHSYVRLSVGLEFVDDIVNDLKQGLDQLQ